MKLNKYFKTWKNRKFSLFTLSRCFYLMWLANKEGYNFTTADCKSANLHVDSVHTFFLYMCKITAINYAESAFPRISSLKQITWFSALFPLRHSGGGGLSENWHIFTTTSLLSASNVLFTSVHWSLLWRCASREVVRRSKAKFWWWWWWRWGYPSLFFLFGSSAVLVSVKCWRSLSLANVVSCESCAVTSIQVLQVDNFIN